MTELEIFNFEGREMRVEFIEGELTKRGRSPTSAAPQGSANRADPRRLTVPDYGQSGGHLPALDAG
jgi:hypothetical protein